MQFVTNNRT